jgi:hypothetical protein
MTSFAVRFILIVVTMTCGVTMQPSVGEAQTLVDFNAVVEKLSANSPAGGPNSNPAAAVFVFFRKSKKLCWVADGKVVSVAIVPTKELDDTKAGGPTPVGEYLIGRRFKHDKHKIDWYRLYPRIENNSGYYGYTAKTKTGRFAMGLHPGAVSLGCVTVRSTKVPYDRSDVWNSVRQELDSSNLRYKNDGFSGFLYVVDK